MSWSLPIALLACPGTQDTTELGTPEEHTTSASCDVSALSSLEQPLSTTDRARVGVPAREVGDPELWQRESELSQDIRTRRAVAWQAAARVLRAAALDRTDISEGTPGSALSAPIWRQWYAKDDLTRVFRHLYLTLSPEERRRRAAFSPDQLSDVWEWNAGKGLDAEGAEPLTTDALGTEPRLGGLYRVLYGPKATSHWLESYGQMLSCRETLQQAAASDPSALPPSDACLASAPKCLSGQFPSGSSIVKATYRRADLGQQLPFYDTSAGGLRARLAGTAPRSWDTPDGTTLPEPGSIYAVSLPSGSQFWVPAVHLMTKDTEHWLWVSLWWSSTPNEDFGADRPRDFPPEWSHYKLCAVTAFDEGSLSARAELSRSFPTLGNALDVLGETLGAASWCSNPYIEQGPGNAATNCIGCHQHAGTGLRSEDILADAERFPDYGRSQVRRNFPSDYVFAIDSGDDLGAMMQETESHYVGDGSEVAGESQAESF